MGKAISRSTVLGKVRRAKELGMHPIAYGAVYAASREFFEQHQDWAFYNSAQQPFVFIDVFYIMNIQAGSPWRDHIICLLYTSLYGTTIRNSLATRGMSPSS